MKAIDNTEARQAVRDAVFDLILNQRARRPTADAVAQQAGMQPEVVEALLPDDNAFHRLMFGPFTEAVDEQLRELPTCAKPTLNDQRKTIDAIIRAVATRPRELALILAFLADREAEPNKSSMDRFAYQVGVRLLGTDYDDPEQVARVYFASEFVVIGALSRRRNLNDEQDRKLFVDSALAILHAHHLLPQHEQDTPRRRWTDRSSPTDHD